MGLALKIQVLNNRNNIASRSQIAFLLLCVRVDVGGPHPYTKGKMRSGYARLVTSINKGISIIDSIM